MTKVAYRAQRSRRKFVNSPKVQRVIAATIESKTKPDLLKMFNLRVLNWKHKPDFRARKKITPDVISVTVFPTGKNKKFWVFVSGGTKPHKIRARGKALSFMWGGPGSYVPKTTSRGGFGGPGIVRNGKSQRRQEVNHPGIRPRKFEELIRKEYAPTFSRDMENAFRRGLR